MIEKEVAWINGIFIKPQHFEQQERAMKVNINEAFNRLSENLWGFSEIEVDKNLLALNQIEFTKCAGWFQDGTRFVLHGAMLQNLKIALPQNTANEIIYLALPINEFMSEVSVKTKRYVIEEVQTTDSLESSDNTVPILVKTLNPCLLLASEKRDGYWNIPALKVIKVDQNQKILLDENYIAPCINIHANYHLSKDLSLISEWFERKQAQLSKLLSSTMRNRNSTSFIDLSILQIINKNVVQLRQFKSQANCHPYEVYCYLANSLAELGTYYREDKLEIAVPNYQHDNLTKCFGKLREALLEVLQTKFEHQATNLELVEQGNFITRAVVSNGQLFKTSDFILCIRTENHEIRDEIGNYIKIASEKELDAIIRLQLPGIAIERLNTVPPQLPYHENNVYYRLLKKGDRWKNTVEEESICIHLGYALKLAQDINLQFFAIPELINSSRRLEIDG